MQSAVTGQDAVSQERKITSGGKQRQTIMHTITETNGIPQTKEEGEINVRTYICTYIYIKIHVIRVCQTSRSRNRNRGDSIVPTRKRQDETNDVQIEIEQREEKRRKNK